MVAELVDTAYDLHDGKLIPHVHIENITAVPEPPVQPVQEEGVS